MTKEHVCRIGYWPNDFVYEGEENFLITDEEYYSVIQKFNYCPDCGKKIEGGETK